MTRKDAASREVGKTLSGGAGSQFRHRTADRQLLQGLAQVFLSGEYAGHTIERISDLYLLIGSRGFLLSHVDMPPHIVNCKQQTVSVSRNTAVPGSAGAAQHKAAVSWHG